MPQKILPTLLLCVGLLTAAGCTDTSPPTWSSGAALNTERSEKSFDVALSWPVAKDDQAVTGYELVRDQGPPLALAPNLTAHTCEKLTDATEHTFRLRARDEAGNWSEPLTANLATPDITPPAWPVERFEAQELEPVGKAAAFKLTWEPATDNVGVTGYLLVREASDFKVELGPEIHEYGLEGEDAKGHYELISLDAAGNRSKTQPCSARSKRLLDRKIALEAGVLKMLSADSAKMSDVFGKSALSDDALGGLIGSDIGDAGGFGELGMGGGGSGGGGMGTGFGGFERPKEKVPGRVTTGVENTSDGLDAASAGKAVASLHGALKACYEKRLKQDAQIAGELELKLTLAGGRVKTIEATGGDLQDAGTRSCVSRVLKRIRLPGVDGSISLKLAFQKPDCLDTARNFRCLCSRPLPICTLRETPPAQHRSGPTPTGRFRTGNFAGWPV